MLAGLALHAHLIDIVDGRVLAGLVEPEPAVARADHAGRPRRLHIRVSPPVRAPLGRRALRSGAPARGLRGGGGSGGNRPPLHSSIDSAAKPAFMQSGASRCETPASRARQNVAGRPGAECAAALPPPLLLAGRRDGQGRNAPRGAAWRRVAPHRRPRPLQTRLPAAGRCIAALPRAAPGLGPSAGTCRRARRRRAGQGWCMTAILAGSPLPPCPRRAAPRPNCIPGNCMRRSAGLNIGVICTGMRAAA